MQSTLRIGHPVPTRTELMAAGVDVVALRLASTILGGSFSSRLNHELREVKGYTYGAHSSFDLGRPQGLYAVSTEVQTDSTAPAVADALRIIREFFDGGATAAELELTRAYLAGATPIGLQSPGAVGERLIEMTRHDLPSDFVTTEHARLLEVEPRRGQRDAARGAPAAGPRRGGRGRRVGVRRRAGEGGPRGLTRRAQLLVSHG